MASPLHARVHGAGLSGALAGLALAEAGWQVSIHDSQSPQRLVERRRAYALTHSSRRLLETLGLWEAIQPRLVPFRRLNLSDQGIGRGIRFEENDLGRTGSGGSAGPVGWIAEHTALMTLLLDRLAERESVRLCLGSTAMPAGSEEPPPDLVVAADGPDSSTRQEAGLPHWTMAYRQACLTVQVELRGSRQDEAWELLRPEGPFAVLPLGHGRFQLVWSAPAWRCRQLESLPDSSFLDALAGALPDRLQPDALFDDPRAFPVALQLAPRLHRANTVLVGESAHRCHPVGGQGLNLCWRDVAVLHRLAARSARGRLAPGRIGAAYTWRRLPDVVVTLAATDLLVRFFSNRHRLLLPLRRLVLKLLHRVPALRRVSLSLMTDGLPQPWTGLSREARIR